MIVDGECVWGRRGVMRVWGADDDNRFVGCCGDVGMGDKGW